MRALKCESPVVRVPMARIGFGRCPEVLQTLLGSCVGIAVWDPTTGYGGLAHIMLPESCGSSDEPGKYADTAVADLKTGLVRRGAHARQLKAKLTGGATMYGPRRADDLGEQNILAARQQLALHQINIMGEHVGGTVQRVIRFSLADGSVEVMHAKTLVAVI